MIRKHFGMWQLRTWPCFQQKVYLVSSWGITMRYYTSFIVTMVFQIKWVPISSQWHGHLVISPGCCCVILHDEQCFWNRALQTSALPQDNAHAHHLTSTYSQIIKNEMGSEGVKDSRRTVQNKISKTSHLGWLFWFFAWNDSNGVCIGSCTTGSFAALS